MPWQRRRTWEFYAGLNCSRPRFGAWQAYLRTVDMRIAEHLVTTGRFLWIDEVPGRAILVAPGMGTGTLAVPNGLIHHWIAAAFIPDANPASVLRVAHDYAN